MKEKVENIFNKLIYIIEFIISVILVKQVFDVLTTKAYKEYYPLNKIIWSAILGILVLGIIIYICKKNKESIEKIFIAFAIPLSIGYAIFVLPLNVPDEGSHILKAYDISIGNIVTQIDEQGNSYCMILKSLENYSHTRFVNYRNIIDEMVQDTDYNDNVKTVCAAQGNSPFLYIGTVIGLKLGQILNLNIFKAIYLARMINIIIFLLFGYLTIKKLPFGKLAMAVYLCMPMMLQQAASCSADAILNAVLIYYIAHLIYMTFKENEITKKDKIILYVLTALVAMFKYVYILVAGILFITIFSKKEERKEKIKTIGIMILIGSIFAIGWFTFGLRFKSSPDVTLEYNKTFNVDQGRQISYIKENPAKFMKTFIKEYIVYGPEYIFGAVGSKLGWLNVNVDACIITPYIIILILSVIAEKSKYEFKAKSKIWIIAIILAISALLKISMYIYFTPVGLERICGVQGRYYTPILFLALLCLVKKDNNWEIKNANQKMMALSMVLNIATLYVVFGNYV